MDAASIGFGQLLRAAPVIASLTAGCAADGPAFHGVPTGDTTDVDPSTSSSSTDTTDSGSSSTGQASICDGSGSCDSIPLTSHEAWIEFRSCSCLDGDLAVGQLDSTLVAAYGASQLQIIDGNLSVDNSSRPLAEYFPKLGQVLGSVSFHQIQVAQALGIVAQITTFNDDLILDHVDHFAPLAHVYSVYGDLRIVGGNDPLDALGNLTRVDGQLELAGRLPYLPPTLASIGGLWIHGYAGGDVRFTGAIEVLGGLEIRDTAELSGFLDLENLSSVGGPIRIENNPELPDCEVIELVDRLLAIGYEGQFTACGNLADACTAMLPACS